MLFLQLYYSFLIPSSVGPIGIVNGEDEYLFLDGWCLFSDGFEHTYCIRNSFSFYKSMLFFWSYFGLASYILWSIFVTWVLCSSLSIARVFVFLFSFFFFFFFFFLGGGSMKRDFAVDNTVAHFFLYLVFFFSSFFFAQLILFTTNRHPNCKHSLTECCHVLPKKTNKNPLFWVLFIKIRQHARLNSFQSKYNGLVWAFTDWQIISYQFTLFSNKSQN